jgi:hypothetical protein
MVENYTFSEIEIEDLLHNHAYEMAEIIEKAYIDIENELRNAGDNNE